MTDNRLDASQLASQLKGKRRHKNLWMAPCPAHKDSTPSLGISNGKKGVVFRCHAGCTQTAVIDALRALGIFGSSSPRSSGGHAAQPEPRRQRDRGAWVALPEAPETPWVALPEAPETLRVPIYRDGAGWTILHGRFGTPDQVWLYHTSTGIAGLVCRFNFATGKEVIPLAPARHRLTGQIRWEWIGLAAPRPLYRFREIVEKPELPVLVHEGEKAADAGAELFPQYVSTTPQGGSNAADKTDWSPVAGRDVLILKDDDAAGHKFAAQVAALAAAAGAASVSLLHWSLDYVVIHDPAGTPQIERRPVPAPLGWDAADAQADGWTPTTAQALIDKVTRVIPIVSY